MVRKIATGLLIIGLTILFLGGCGSEEVSSGFCDADSDCPSGMTCDRELQTCKCYSDEACAVGEVCNLRTGHCQLRPNCHSNSDCKEQNAICDSKTGACIPSNVCTQDIHCEFGQQGSYCQIATGNKSGKCTPGCTESYHCPLGQGPGSRYVCSNGQCAVGCKDNSYCSWKKICSVKSKTCMQNPRPDDYCKPCNSPLQCTSLGSGAECVSLGGFGQTSCGFPCNPTMGNNACPGEFSCLPILYIPCPMLQGCPAGSKCVPLSQGSMYDVCVDKTTGDPVIKSNNCFPSNGICK